MPPAGPPLKATTTPSRKPNRVLPAGRSPANRVPAGRSPANRSPAGRAPGSALRATAQVSRAPPSSNRDPPAAATSISARSLDPPSASPANPSVLARKRPAPAADPVTPSKRARLNPAASRSNVAHESPSNRSINYSPPAAAAFSPLIAAGSPSAFTRVEKWCQRCIRSFMVSETYAYHKLIMFTFI